MNNADIQFYKENGFIILRNILSVQEINKIRSDIHTIIQQQLALLGLPIQRETTTESIFKDMQTLHQHDLGKYLSSLRLCAKVTSIYQAIMNKNLLETSTQLGISLPIFQTQPVLN